MRPWPHFTRSCPSTAIRGTPGAGGQVCSHHPIGVFHATFYEKTDPDQRAEAPPSTARGSSRCGFVIFAGAISEPPIREFMSTTGVRGGRNGKSGMRRFDRPVRLEPSMYNYSIVANHLAARLMPASRPLRFTSGADRITDGLFLLRRPVGVDRTAGATFLQQGPRTSRSNRSWLKTKWDVLHIQFEGVTVRRSIYEPICAI